MSEHPPMPPGNFPPPPAGEYQNSSQPTGPAPSSVVNAVRLIYVFVALAVVRVIVFFATEGSLKDQVRKDHPEYSSSKVDSVITAGSIGVIIGALIAIGLFIWLAIKIGQGRNWARITAWVLLGLEILFSLIGLAGTASGTAKALAVLGLIVEIAVVVLLALKDSNRFFSDRPS